MARTSDPPDRDGALRVVMFPFFAFGHISPFVHLASRLAASGCADVTILTTPATAPRIASMLRASSAPGDPSRVRIHPLDLPHVDGLPDGAESTDTVTLVGAELLKVALDMMQPQVGEVLAELRPHVAIHDFTHQWLPALARPLGIKTVYFSVFSPVGLAFLIVPSRRHLEDAGEEEVLVRDLQLPPSGFPRPPESTIESIPTYQAGNLVYLWRRFFGMPSVYRRFVETMENCSAIAFKTCMDLEGPYVRCIEETYKKPVFLVGPLVPEPSAKEDVLETRWAEWLDGFPEGSVIFCSFGSETFLSDDGIRELALGLEMTGRPFLLVVNFPKADVGEGPNVDPVTILRMKLPDGLEGRLAGRGVVHSGWVQQKLILSHRSVGCFLNHAGLSSLTEGLVAGCQLVLLPQKGDQFSNARLFAGDLRVAVEVRRRDWDGWFGGDDIRDAVSQVTADDENGRQVRESHRRWRDFFVAPDVNQRFLEDFVVKLRALVADKG